ncbi:hypothetical protein [Aeromonas bivalvium]|uniref:hypothetical protein n=1 Tax=Aeromonas bivalvium TaxID=440079 RepID=UPI0005A91E2B|nr:hypothetical protein [Aeromonas bivalvium]
MNQPMSRPLASLTAGLTQPWPTRHLTRRPGASAMTMGDGAQLLGALGEISQAKRGWILLIAPPGLPVAAQLRAHGIDPAHVLVVHGHKIKNWQRTLELALDRSRCAAVVTWLPESISLDTERLLRLTQGKEMLTHYFQRETSQEPAVNYGNQDVYLNH